MAPEVIVVGGGIGGLCAAIVLAAGGRRVTLLERSMRLGGKAGVAEVDGVEFDAGPSVLTLPDVFDDVFRAAGLCREEEITLIESSPAFRYLYPDGVVLDVHHRVEETLASVGSVLGSEARRDLSAYLEYSRQIWEAAAPHFVMGEAPNVTELLLGGLKAFGLISKIDPFNSLRGAIDKRVRSPHLRMLLKRYATYNGSDARTAPATLGCIAHVELTLGGYGVKGGMSELVAALGRCLERVGVEVRLGADVDEIVVQRGRVLGVRLTDEQFIAAHQVVANADVGHLAEKLLRVKSEVTAPKVPSMSAFNGVYRAKRTNPGRSPHTVVFPTNYDAEFSDIFDRGRIPLDPTIYLCAQEACHQRRGWPQEEPVFVMINAPIVSSPRTAADASSDAPEVRAHVEEKLRRVGLLGQDDVCVWWRTPWGLSEAFPGSRGALYGAASNDKTAAFRRPPNRIAGIRGLYLASGSAHPGGGVPMVAQSGKSAARSALFHFAKDSA